MTAQDDRKKDLLSRTEFATCVCPEGEDEIYYRDVVPGLEMKVTRTGKKSLYFRRRPPPAQPGRPRQNARRRKLWSLPAHGDPRVLIEKARAEATRLNLVVDEEKRDIRFEPYDVKRAVHVGDVLRAYQDHLKDRPSEREVARLFGEFLEVFPEWPLAEMRPRVLREHMEQTFGPGSAKAARNGGKPLAGLGSNLLLWISAAYNLAAQDTSRVQTPPGTPNPTRGVRLSLRWMVEHQVEGHSRAFSPEEWEDILQAVDKAHAAYPDDPAVMIIDIAIHSGARPSELMRLVDDEIRRGTVKLDSGEIRPWVHLIIPKHKTTWRGKGPREIKLVPRSIQVLDRALAARARTGYTGPYVFYNARTIRREAKRGRTISPVLQSLAKHMHKIQKFCTVERLRAYGFRGAFINLMNEKLGDAALPSIAEAVGHADLNSTIKHYRKVRGAKGEEFVAQVGEAFGFWSVAPAKAAE